MLQKSVQVSLGVPAVDEAVAIGKMEWKYRK